MQSQMNFVKRYTRTQPLKALGVGSYQYGTLLIPIFMEELPDELKLIVSRNHTDNWELETIMDAVKSEVQARDRTPFTACWTGIRFRKENRPKNQQRATY